MQFTDSLFLFYFLPAALFLHTLAARQNGKPGYPYAARLAIFSLTLIFYGCRQWWWLFPLFLSMSFDFLWARALSRTTRPALRRALVFASVIQNMGLLAFFKYWGFFHSQLETFFPQSAGYLPTVQLNNEPLPLPPGISFYTFESLSFVIDVYRGVITPPQRALDFFAFLAMFPRFVAGPIVRYRDMAGQFTSYSGPRIERGLFIFAAGFILKTMLADHFAVFVPYAFHENPQLTFAAAWFGVIAYCFQIYFDFAGYSLMAIGLGHCLGFVFPTNFNQPYQATSLRDFWHRWHISLSMWLRDYVYIPLGGNKHRRDFNLFLTMLLGGLWHGANWTFVVWGAWHGAFLILERRFESSFLFSKRWGRVRTFSVVLMGWVFFKAANVRNALHIFRALIAVGETPLAMNWEAVNRNPIAVFFCFLGISYCLFFEKQFSLVHLETRVDWPTPRKMAAAFLFTVSLVLALSVQSIPFLYFRF